MNDSEYQQYNSARRMVAVVAANNEVFRPNVKAMALVTALAADISILEAAGAKRVSATGLQSEGTHGKQTARLALENLVRKIASNARTIKISEPDFDNNFIIPRNGFSDLTLIDTARAFADNLDAAAVAKFGEISYSAANSANVQTKIAAFEVERARQDTGKGGGVAATAETKAAIKHLGINRRLLKTIGENIVAENNDAGLIGEWKSASRLAKPKAAPPSTPSTPPTA